MRTKETETLTIEGMSCGHCVRAVENALSSVEGVEVEQVAIGSARVSYDPEQVSRDELIEAVEVEGYRVQQ
jgi:copper chaperone